MDHDTNFASVNTPTFGVVSNWIYLALFFFFLFFLFFSVDTSISMFYKVIYNTKQKRLGTLKSIHIMFCLCLLVYLYTSYNNILYV